MPLLDALRRHTREQHDALHTHPLLAPLAGGPVAAEDFHHILQAFDAWYRAAESARRVAMPADVPDAPVLDWLARDLARQDIAQHNLDFAPPAIDTPSKLMGYLYTKQGSTLGGHVISKHLQRQLGLVPGADQWFFAGYNGENGLKWHHFIAALEAGDYDEAETVTAAQGAFDGIARACDQIQHSRALNAA